MSSTDHLSELESLRSQVAELTGALAERDHSMQDLREQSQLLRTIIEGTAAETGDEFFSSLVKHLTSTLHVQYAVIGEVFEGRSRKIRTLAVSAGGTLADNFEYELAHTPCATALAQTFACFDRDVQATFPQFQRLADLGAESYCGVPLRTKGGAVIGLLVVMDTKPLVNSNCLQSLLEVFAPRVAVEIERRRTEQERADALADLRNVVETAPDIMFTLDTQGNMVKWNRRVRDVTGYSPEELLNKPALAFVPPEEQTRTGAAIQRVFTEGYAELEGQLLTKEHRLIPYHWTGALLKNPHGEPIGITGIGRDVSDKKRTEEELQSQRRHLVEAQAIAHLGSWDWDIDTGEVQWSDELFRIFGHEPGSIHVMYDTFLAALLPDDHDRVLAAINDALVGKLSYDIEYRIVRPNGEVRSIHACGGVHRDATGHPLSMAGTVLDITERKRADEALRKSEERYVQATAAGKVGVWELDVVTGTYHGDPNLKALFGYVGDELSTDPYIWLNLVHPDDQSIALDHWQRIVDGERDIYNYELRMLKKDGTVIWTDIRGHAVRDHEGQVTQLFGTTVDISERKQVQDALVQSEHQIHAVLNALPVGVWFTDQSGKPLLSNPAAKQIWSNIKQVGMQTPNNQSGWWETIGLGNELHRWALSRTLTTGVPSLNEIFDLECLDGTKKTIRNSTVPVQDEAGNILGAIVLNEDITMLRRAQAALQLTQFSVDHAIEGFFWIGPDARIFHVNDSACRMLEYTREELTTMTVHDIEPNLLPEVWPAHWKELKQKGYLTFESKQWSRTGRVLDTEVTVNYLQYEGREYNCAIMRDIGERKRAEAALRASEGQFRTIFTQAPFGIALIDSLTGLIHEVNATYAHIADRTREELCGCDWMSISHPDDVQTDLDNMARLNAGEIAGFQMEKRLVRPDGTIIWIHLTVAPIHIEATAGPHHLAMMTDITARKQVEDALRQSEERLRSFMMNSPSLVFFKGLDGRYLYVNREFERMFQLSAGQIIGKTDYAVFSREQADQFAVNDRRVLHEGHALETEETASYEDGTHTSLVMKFPVCGADGAVWGIGGIVTDITQRKQAEAALRASEERYRSLYDDTPTMYFTLSADGTVRSVNRFGAEQLGYRVEELIGHSVLSLFHGQDRETVAASLSECLATPETSRNWEFRKVRKDGTIIWVRETARVGQSSTGETVVLVTCEDITERRANEQILTGEKRILEMITTDVSLQEVLTLMCQMFEGLSSGAHCSILLLDPDGLHLRHSAAPSLPEAYVHAIDGLAIGPTAGCCGTAAFMRRQVIVSDIARDPLWADFRDLALRHGLQACWSTPVISSDGTVLGTFAVYYGEPKPPTDTDLRLIERTVHIACIAIERRRAAQEQYRLIENLTRSQQHFQNLFNWTPSAVGISTVAEGRFCDVNEAFSRLTGYAREEVIGRTTLDLALWADPLERATVLREMRKQGYLHNREGLLRTKSGEIRSLMVSVESIQIGSTPCLIYLGHDITERKRAEEALRLAKFSMDRAADAVYWIDPQANILDVNEAASLMLGYSKDELCSMTVHDLNPDFRADMWPGFWAETQRRGTMVIEATHRAKTGRLIPIEVSVNYLSYEGKEYHCAFVRNITDRKRAEEVLQQRERDLQAALDERERISQDLHDGILQSLFAVGLTLETTKSMMSPTIRKKSGAPLDQAIGQLNLVMREIRNFIAGLDSDLLQGQDLPTALQQMLASLTENQATRVRLAVEDRAAKALSTEQSLHLIRVVQEAVSNCIRHGHAQEARVSLKMLKQGVRLSIRDNGRGFNQDTAKGTGHGLGNMAARAEKIGGRFAVFSKINQGTRIVFDLPARPGARG